MKTAAILSEHRVYRYLLRREWAPGPTLPIIMLNPSTADETEDDPTIRRCVGFAKSWGYGALCVANLFALRATDPKALIAHPSPIGPRNDEILARIAEKAQGPILCAWGAHKMAETRSREVIDRFRTAGATLQALRVTKGGAPAHPLYMPANLTPITF
jgi:hypothetical protein